MLRNRRRIPHHLILAGSAAGGIADLARGLWHSDTGRRWMIPLAVFLCVIGLILALGASIEALAPFIYAIF